MRALLGALGLSLMVVGAVGAQPRCVKGKPCGNTCIAQNRTCRTAAPAAKPEAAPVRTPATASASPTKSAAQLRADSVNAAERARTAMATATRPDTGAPREPDFDPALSPFVGDATRKILYKRGCAAAGRVREDDLVVFMTTTAAISAGYARSGAPGC